MNCCIYKKKITCNTIYFLDKFSRQGREMKIWIAFVVDRFADSEFATFREKNGCDLAVSSGGGWKSVVRRGTRRLRRRRKIGRVARSRAAWPWARNTWARYFTLAGEDSPKTDRQYICLSVLASHPLFLRSSVDFYAAAKRGTGPSRVRACRVLITR